MDWLIENAHVVFVVVSTAIVVVVFLYLRYGQDRAGLWKDVENLLGDALEYLKGQVGDRMAEVTEEEVHKVADLFYDRFVLGTVLEKVVTREHMRSALWKLFTEWRDWYSAMQFALEV